MVVADAGQLTRNVNLPYFVFVILRSQMGALADTLTNFLQDDIIFYQCIVGIHTQPQIHEKWSLVLC